MENASKALLIAAAVLITIIIITVGIKVYTSTSGTQKVALDTGKTISDKTGVATDMATSFINGEEYSPTVEIGSLTSDNYGDYIDLGKSIVGTDATTDDWRILYKQYDCVYVILNGYLPNDKYDTGLKKYGTYNVYSETNRNNLMLYLGSGSKDLISNTLPNLNSISVYNAISADIISKSYSEKYGRTSSPTNTNKSNFYNEDYTTYDDLYVLNEGREDNWCYGYWLKTAVSGSGLSEWVQCVSCVNHTSRAKYNSKAYGLRPVVRLNLDTRIKKVNNVWQIVE